MKRLLMILLCLGNYSIAFGQTGNVDPCPCCKTGAPACGIDVTAATIAPATAKISLGQAQLFTATFGGNPVGVNWSIAAGSTSGGALTPPDVCTSKVTYKPATVGTATIVAKCGDITLGSATVTVFKGFLHIANAQGGSLLPEDKKVIPGAFTVANLNDTDGDGANTPTTLDNTDNDVPGEKDLMRLELHKPDPDVGGSVTLTVTPNTVKLWEHDTKGTPVTTLTFPTSGTFPQTIWVEATAKSATLRDIVITANYNGCSDIVKATAVSAERKPSRFWDTHVVGPPPALNGDADGTEINNAFNNHFDSALGYGSFHPAGPLGPVKIGSRMQQEFTVEPPGVGVGVENGEGIVVFDLSRQKSSQAHAIADGEVIAGDPIDFPTTGADKFEKPTDDNLSNDEDNLPLRNHIYSIDGPSIGFPPVVDFMIVRTNFREFARVKFDGAAFVNNNNVVEGSRCSPLEPWHFIAYLKRGPAGGAVYIQDNAAISASAAEFTSGGAVAGKGTMTAPLTTANTVTEGWTVTCITAAANGGTFSVVGTVSGAQNNYDITTGIYGSTIPALRVIFRITDGATDFAVGDAFHFSTFKTAATKKNEIKEGEITITGAP